MSNETVDLGASVGSRRDLLKLAGAAAVGAAGGLALRTIPAKAGGSGNTIVLFNPTRVRRLFGPLHAGHDYTFGPFPVPGSTLFNSTDYYGMIGNLTAVGWNGRGWLAVRPHGAPLPSPPPFTVNFSGPPSAWSNLFVVGFGPPAPGAVSPVVSDGKITIHCGSSSGLVTTNIVIDLYAYLGPDQ